MHIPTILKRIIPFSGVYIFKIYAWCGKWNGNFNQTVLIDCSIARTGFLEDRLWKIKKKGRGGQISHLKYLFQVDV